MPPRPNPLVSGLDELLLIAASIALAAGTPALLLIRQSDFATAVLEASAA
jgi:hypothetical protein